MTDIKFRPPRESDIETLTQLHFYIWNDYYSGFVPKAYAEKYYTLEKCRALQTAMVGSIMKYPDEQFALIAVDKDDALAGMVYLNRFIYTGYDLDIRGFDVELQHLYLWPQYRNKDLGSSLLLRARSWMREYDYHSFFTWTLDDNPSAQFHLRHKVDIVKTMVRDYEGTKLNLTAYGLHL